MEQGDYNNDLRHYFKSRQERRQQRKRMNRYMAIGISIGIMIGAALYGVTRDAICLTLGIGVGILYGVACGSREKKNDNSEE